MRATGFLIAAGIVVAATAGQSGNATDRRYLYVAEPGIRNYVEYGGVGVLVFDISDGYKFIKRITTWETPAGKDPEDV